MVQVILAEDMGAKRGKDAEMQWKTVSIQNGILIQASLPIHIPQLIDLKALKSLFKLTISLLFMSHYILSGYLGMNPFLIGIVLAVFIIKKVKNCFDLTPRMDLVKGRTIIKGLPHSIGKTILNSYSSDDNQFDHMLVEKRTVHRNEEDHITHTEETFDLPCDSIVRSFIPRMKGVKVQTYWCSESNKTSQGPFYILRKATEMQEAFVIMPMKKAS